MASARSQTPTSSAATATSAVSVAATTSPESASPAPPPNATRAAGRVGTIEATGATSTSPAAAIRPPPSSTRTSTSAPAPPTTRSAAPSRATPSAPVSSPLARPGSHRACWSPEPACSIRVAARAVGRNGTGASARPSSSARIESSMAPRPCPPCSSATEMPGQPSPASSRQSASSVVPASACSRTRSGVAREPRSSRAVRWMSRWSSVSPKSTPFPLAHALGGRELQAREPEDPLGDDVLEDLRRAALDRVAPGAQQLVAPRRAGGERFGPDDVGRELGEPLVRVGPEPLDQRPLGARLAVLLDVGQALPGQKPDRLRAHVQLRERVGDDRVLELARAARLDDEVVEQLAQTRLEREPEAGALVHERRQGDLPPVADATDDVGVGDAHLLEEELVELRLARDLAQRPDGHAGLLHVHEEVGEALVLRDAPVRPRHEHAPLRVLGAARPHLLAGDHPLVAVLDRLRLQRGEVGPGVRLGEALAPDLLAGEDRPQVTLLLVPRSPDHQGRTTEEQAEDVGRERHASAAELLEVDRRLRQRGAPAAVLGGPVRRGPAAVVEAALPVAPPCVEPVLV